MSSEFANEQQNNISDVLRKLKQSWNDRLILPLSKLPERYLRGELGVHCHISDLNGNAKICLSLYFPNHLRTQVKVEGRGDECEFPMFIGSVHIMDNEQWVVQRVRSHVWLQTVDQCCRAGADALYLATISGKFTFRRSRPIGIVGCNGKLDIDETRRSEYLGCQLESKMIEGGSQMVGDLSSKNAEPEGNRSSAMFIDSLKERLVVVIVPDRCGAVLKENLDFPAKIDDVFIGPF